jgi:hypothetical protein
VPGAPAVPGAAQGQSFVESVQGAAAGPDAVASSAKGSAEAAALGTQPGAKVAEAKGAKDEVGEEKSDLVSKLKDVTKKGDGG